MDVRSNMTRSWIPKPAFRQKSALPAIIYDVLVTRCLTECVPSAEADPEMEPRWQWMESDRERHPRPGVLDEVQRLYSDKVRTATLDAGRKPENVWVEHGSIEREMRRMRTRWLARHGWTILVECGRCCLIPDEPGWKAMMRQRLLNEQAQELNRRVDGQPTKG